MKHQATQLLLSLTQTVITERAHSLVCIPDKFAADTELMHLEAEYGPRLIKATIRKDRPGAGSTYTLRYFTREKEIRHLF
jgi:hypothetical protein